MNGVKSRVEKLCQAFENGMDLVELSDFSPHDICNVLKLYLRQVGLICFTYYEFQKCQTEIFLLHLVLHRFRSSL